MVHLVGLPITITFGKCSVTHPFTGEQYDALMFTCDIWNFGGESFLMSYRRSSKIIAGIHGALIETLIKQYTVSIENNTFKVIIPPNTKLDTVIANIQHIIQEHMYPEYEHAFLETST